MTAVMAKCLCRAVVSASDLQCLLIALTRRGYSVIGPTVKDGAIVLDELASVEDLPVGWTDLHEAGRYALARRADDAWFGFNLSATSWKAWLHPPVHRLCRAVREGGVVETRRDVEPPRLLALFGVRACELEAILKLDAVLQDGRYGDTVYSARRSNALIIAVTCAESSADCFCTSVGAGPRPHTGFDLCLTEVIEARRHYFVVEAGTDVGAELLDEIPHADADEKQESKPDSIASRTAARMRKSANTEGLRELLYESYEHPHWDEVGAKCLTCGNCTMVCPTCFCTTVEDTADLSGSQAERTRRWDSCFTMDFSFINGGSVRYSAAARYRHWLVHKFASWQDQFGGLGCVGCGRCITWCPAGIDITEEIRALRKRAHRTKGRPDEVA